MGVFLTRLGKGLSHQVIGDLFGIARSTSMKIVNELCQYFLYHTSDFIVFPTGVNLLRTIHLFE